MFLPAIPLAFAPTHRPGGAGKALKVDEQRLALWQQSARVRSQAARVASEIELQSLMSEDAEQSNRRQQPLLDNGEPLGRLAGFVQTSY